jgi:hypothetical protein
MFAVRLFRRLHMRAVLQRMASFEGDDDLIVMTEGDGMPRNQLQQRVTAVPQPDLMVFEPDWIHVPVHAVPAEGILIVIDEAVHVQQAPQIGGILVDVESEAAPSLPIGVKVDEQSAAPNLSIGLEVREDEAEPNLPINLEVVEEAAVLNFLIPIEDEDVEEAAVPNFLIPIEDDDEEAAVPNFLIPIEDDEHVQPSCIPNIDEEATLLHEDLPSQNTTGQYAILICLEDLEQECESPAPEGDSHSLTGSD